jgi:hypothetical protein
MYQIKYMGCRYLERTERKVIDIGGASAWYRLLSLRRELRKGIPGLWQYDLHWLETIVLMQNRFCGWLSWMPCTKGGWLFSSCQLFCYGFSKTVTLVALAFCSFVVWWKEMGFGIRSTDFETISCHLCDLDWSPHPPNHRDMSHCSRASNYWSLPSLGHS